MLSPNKLIFSYTFFLKLESYIAKCRKVWISKYNCIVWVSLQKVLVRTGSNCSPIPRLCKDYSQLSKSLYSSGRGKTAFKCLVFVKHHISRAVSCHLSNSLGAPAPVAKIPTAIVCTLSNTVRYKKTRQL